MKTINAALIMIMTIMAIIVVASLTIKFAPDKINTIPMFINAALIYGGFTAIGTTKEEA